jgi:hypothetical protein
VEVSPVTWQPDSPYAYIYLDGPGIDGLFSQITERLETGFKETTERGKRGKVSGSIGFSKALAALLKGELSAEGELSKKSVEEATSMLTTEQKLRNLQIYLSKSEKSTFFVDLSLARGAARSKNAAVFISLSSVYCKVPQFMPGGGGVQQVNEDGAVLLKVGADPESIPMAASLTKMPRTAKGLMGGRRP